MQTESHIQSIFQIPWHLLESDDIPQWLNPHNFLEPSFFKALCNEYPSINHFEWHNGYQRKHGQRAHNRYYASYEEPIHHHKSYIGKGVLRNEDLSDNWKFFIHEMQTNEEYKSFMRKFLKIPNFYTRYEFHMGIDGCEVSPHLDAPAKAGKHIFYFNTSDDWDEAWGGQTLMLDEKLTDTMNPEFLDFRKIVATKVLENYSFLQRCTPTSWHGVRKLNSPPNKYRKILNVVWEYPDINKSDLSLRANYI